MSSRIHGTVKWFSPEKGYGFIRRAGGGPDVFLHSRALPKGCVPKEGDLVEFDVETTRKGESAIEAKIVEFSDGDVESATTGA